MSTGAATTTTATTTTMSSALGSMDLGDSARTKTDSCCKNSSFNRQTSVKENPCNKLPASNEPGDKPEGEKGCRDLTGANARKTEVCCPGSSCRQTVKDDSSPDEESIRKDVSKFYSTISGNDELKTGACCADPSKMPKHIQKIIELIPSEICGKSYGCGSPFPSDSENIEGNVVLDLGCGTGRDCYIFSKLVGEKGHVIGVDMTPEPLAIANKHSSDMAKKFGYQASNVQFLKGFIEDLEPLGIENDTIDRVSSNCVFNLPVDKESLFSEILRVLKPGGKLVFSDPFSTEDLPEPLQSDALLRNECLGGAITFARFVTLINSLSTSEYYAEIKVLASNPVAINNPEVEKKLGTIKFHSMTIEVIKQSANPREQEKPA